jgi:hypothetical protein
VEVRGVKVYADASGTGLPVLAIPEARGTQSWPRLLVGQLIPAKWEVDSPSVAIELETSDEGDLELPVLPVLPPLDLRVTDGTLSLHRGEAPPVHLRDLELNATRARLRALLSGSATGRIELGDTPIGGFRVELSGWRDEMSLDANLRDLDLAALGQAFGTDIAGKANGSVQAAIEDGQVRASIDASVDGFRLRVENFRRPIAPARTRVVADLRWDGKNLIVRPNPIALDDLIVSGEIRLRTGKRNRLFASLDAAPFRPGTPSGRRLHFISLMGLRHQMWADMNQRIEAGVIEGFHVDLDLPVADLGTALAFRRKMGPEELRLVAQIREGIYRPSPDTAPIEQVSGQIELAGNVLTVRDVHLEREGEPLPRIDISVDGMHRLAHLPVDERDTPTGPGVDIGGLGAAVAALREGDEETPDAPPVELRDVQIGYPGFLLPIRDAYGTMKFPDGVLVIEDAKAVVGGVPAQVSVRYDPGAYTVEARIVYGDEEAPPPRDPGPYWVSGEFSVDPLWLGVWRMDHVEGRMQGLGADIAVPEVRGSFSGGAATGSGAVSLASPDYMGFNFLLSLTGADARGLCAPLLREPDSLTGSLFMDGRFSGRLGPERLVLQDADFGLAFRMENGTVGDLPAMVALARLPSLQGMKALFGTELPYESMSGDLTIRDGILRTENFALQGPELRAHARGSIEIVTDEMESDMVLAFFFLRTVDQLLGTVPVVGDWVLGKDQSLVAVYLQLEGPWEDPDIRPLTQDAVEAAAGWALNLVASGANQLMRFIWPKGTAAPTPAPPTPERNESDGTSPGQDP